MAGYVAPDGRPPQAPGVGKNSKRHDLEAPATPGVRNSDMRQGDRQMLEAGQKVAPRPKKSAPRGSAGGGAPAAGGGGMQVPDAIEFAAGRMGGKSASAGPPVRQVDTAAWRPLVERIRKAFPVAPFSFQFLYRSLRIGNVHPDLVLGWAITGGVLVRGCLNLRVQTKLSE